MQCETHLAGAARKQPGQHSPWKRHNAVQGIEMSVLPGSTDSTPQSRQRPPYDRSWAIRAPLGVTPGRHLHGRALTFMENVRLSPRHASPLHVRNLGLDVVVKQPTHHRPCERPGNDRHIRLTRRVGHLRNVCGTCEGRHRTRAVHGHWPGDEAAKKPRCVRQGENVSHERGEQDSPAPSAQHARAGNGEITSRGCASPKCGHERCEPHGTRGHAASCRQRRRRPAGPAHTQVREQCLRRARRHEHR